MHTFWDNVDIAENVNECWDWQGQISSRGYGIFESGQTLHYAHRIAYALAYGVEIDNDTVVRQTCNNPTCCNPKHLTVIERFVLPIEQLLHDVYIY